MFTSAILGAGMVASIVVGMFFVSKEVHNYMENDNVSAEFSAFETW